MSADRSVNVITWGLLGIALLGGLVFAGWQDVVFFVIGLFLFVVLPAALMQWLHWLTDPRRRLERDNQKERDRLN